MTNFFKFLVFLAPVGMLIVYLAVLHSQEISIRTDIQNKQFRQATNCFEKDWANFDNPRYWKEKQKHPCTLGNCPEKEKQLEHVEQKEYAVAADLGKAMSDANITDNKTKKIYIPK